MSRLELRLVLSDDETNPSQLVMMVSDMMRYVKGKVRVDSLSISSLVRSIPSADFSAALAFIKQGQARGCTDKDLAGKLGISPEHLSRIKNDHASLSPEIATKVIEVMTEMGIDTSFKSDTAAESE